MDTLLKQLEALIRHDVFGPWIAAVSIFIITIFVAQGSAHLMRRFLQRESSNLPNASIFINLIRILIWVIGISLILSLCFNIDVSAIITALGVGGIAVSLGFQATIANLIGGLQVSMSHIVQPGDNIKVEGDEVLQGVVTDITWRHTTLVDAVGNQVIVPNSAINSSAIVKLAPTTKVSIPLVVTAGSGRLTHVAHVMEDAALKALKHVCKVKVKPQISFTEATDFGFRGTMTFTIAAPERVSSAKDAVLRAISPYIHGLPDLKVVMGQHSTVGDSQENAAQEKAVLEKNRHEELTQENPAQEKAVQEEAKQEDPASQERPA